MGAEDYVPPSRRLDELSRAAEGCRGCHLHQAATQTVFGSGDPHARLVLVGEQPGDVEDRSGEPFVGPAGRVLFQCLAELGVARDEVYVTNAVKHFGFTPQGKRRIHKTPSLSDLVACKPWLDAELETLRPDVLVCLGATATRAVMGSGHSVMKERGVLREGTGDSPEVLLTVHPSAVLRSPDRAKAYEALRDDLRVAVAALAPAGRTGRRALPALRH